MEKIERYGMQFWFLVREKRRNSIDYRGCCLFCKFKFELENTYNQRFNVFEGLLEKRFTSQGNTYSLATPHRTPTIVYAPALLPNCEILKKLLVFHKLLNVVIFNWFISFNNKLK